MFGTWSGVLVISVGFSTFTHCSSPAATTWLVVHLYPTFPVGIQNNLHHSPCLRFILSTFLRSRLTWQPSTDPSLPSELHWQNVNFQIYNAGDLWLDFLTLLLGGGLLSPYPTLYCFPDLNFLPSSCYYFYRGRIQVLIKTDQGCIKDFLC